MKEALGCIGIITLILGLLALEAWIVMALWNWLAVSMFGLPEVTFWMAGGLMVLCNILFKGSASVSTKK